MRSTHDSTKWKWGNGVENGWAWWVLGGEGKWWCACVICTMLYGVHHQLMRWSTHLKDCTTILFIWIHKNPHIFIGSHKMQVLLVNSMYNISWLCFWVGLFWRFIFYYLQDSSALIRSKWTRNNFYMVCCKNGYMSAMDGNMHTHTPSMLIWPSIL